MTGVSSFDILEKKKKKLIFLLSVIIEITPNKLLCFISVTLVIHRHLQLLKTVPPTEKTAAKLCKSKPHISDWMRKITAMLNIKKTQQVQRAAINLFNAWTRLTCVQEHILAPLSSMNADPALDIWDLNPLKDWTLSQVVAKYLILYGY